MYWVEITNKIIERMKAEPEFANSLKQSPRATLEAEGYNISDYELISFLGKTQHDDTKDAILAEPLSPEQIQVLEERLRLCFESTSPRCEITP